jgi:hypothetical protein
MEPDRFKINEGTTGNVSYTKSSANEGTRSPNFQPTDTTQDAPQPFKVEERQVQRTEQYNVWSGSKPPSKSFSEAYIQHNTSLLVAKISKEMQSWRDAEDGDFLFNLSKIQDLVEHYRTYMSLRSEHRVLISLINLIFTNNAWQSMTPGQVNSVIESLKKFKDGDVTSQKLKVFAQEMQRAGIGVLKSEDEQEE